MTDRGLAGGQFGCAQVELATPDPFDPSAAQSDQTVNAFVLKPPAPQLGLLTTIPHELGRGQSRTTEVVVANAGNLTARDVTVTIASGPGARSTTSPSPAAGGGELK